MPAADKCHLNIPFKEYFRGLRVDGEGKILQSAIDLAASQEFENYKAIERRINDPECDTGCSCSFVHAIADSDTLILSGGVSVTITFAWNTIAEQTGGWSTSGGNLIPPDSTLLYNVDVIVGFVQSSGTGAVMGGIRLTDDLTISPDAPSVYMPADFGGGGTASRLMDMDPVGFRVDASLRGAGATTRTMGVTAALFAIATCCTSPYPT